ncbi:MAG: hypothetical protein ABGZ53_19460, partial [Fuerstiella sp.]
DNAGPGTGGAITITTVSGNITTQAGATLDARGGDADAVPDGVPDVEGGTITLDANDAGAGVQDNVGDITVGAAIDTSTELAKPIRVILNAEEDVNINAAVTTRGASVDVDAAANINSDNNGDINTTGDKINKDSGDVTIDSTVAALNGAIILAGDIDTSGRDNPGGAADSNGGNVSITTADGNIEVSDITSSGGDVAGAAVGGNAGVISITALDGNPANTVTLTGDLTSAGGVSLGVVTLPESGVGASILFVDPVILGADVNITTSGNGAGDVRFTQTLDGDTGLQSLTITARDTEVNASPASGDVTFVGAVGGVERLGTLTVADGDDVWAMAQVTATRLIQQQGTGDTTLNGVDILSPANNPLTHTGFDPMTDVTDATNQIDLTGHGLNTGDIVVYRTVDLADPDAPPLQPLEGLNSGQPYYVITVDANTIQLAATFANAQNGSAIDLAPGTNTGLTHFLTEYQPSVAITTDDTVNLRGDITVQDVPFTFDAATAVNAATEGIALTGHGLQDGDHLKYDDGGGTTIPGLTSGTTYVVIVVDPDTIQLAASVADQVAGMEIDLTGTGSGGGHQFRLVDATAGSGEFVAVMSVDGDIIIENGVTISTDEDAGSSIVTGDSLSFTANVEGASARYIPFTFDAPTAVSPATDEIALPGHGLQNGDHLTYHNGGSADIPGLTAETDYVVIVVDPNTIRLASIAGTAIDLTGTGAGATHGFTPTSGLFSVGDTVDIRTDGGVAMRFAARPFPTGLGTAFFEFSANPIPSTLQNDTTDQLNFRSEWQVLIGATGEENLRFHIDWRDPADVTPAGPGTGPFLDTTTNLEVTSNRFQTFQVDGGMTQVIGHVYTNQDATALSNIPTFDADFSVSHHSSISVVGDHVAQTTAETVSSRVLSSTDDPDTGTGILDPVTQAAVVVDATAQNADLHFENGLLEVVLPTPAFFIPDPVADPPDRLAPPSAEPVVPVPDPVLATPAEPVEFPTTSLSTQSEDFFQLRQKGSNEPVPGYEHIDDELGWKILQPNRLRKWVQEEGLNGSDYELWVITTKVKDDGSVRFERPVLRFDVFDNQPFPMEESIPDLLPELRLERLDVDENGNLLDSAPGEDTDATPMPDDADDVRVNSDDDEVEALVIPRSEATSQIGSVSGTAAQSAMAGLAVSQLLGRKRRTKAVLSPHTSMISRILNRGTEQK